MFGRIIGAKKTARDSERFQYVFREMFRGERLNVLLYNKHKRLSGFIQPEQPHLVFGVVALRNALVVVVDHRLWLLLLWITTLLCRDLRLTP